MTGIGSYPFNRFPNNPYSDIGRQAMTAGSDTAGKAALLGAYDTTAGSVLKAPLTAPQGKVSDPRLTSTGRTQKTEECQTCKNRKYQDGSDENVSFKSAAKIAKGAEASAVRGHEMEHVANAYSEAAQDENKKVLSVGVTIKTAICPECGRTYISGGETRTVMKYSDEANPYQKNAKSYDAQATVGANVDYSV